MNLKESFRYQSFLEAMMRNASSSLMQREHCLKTTKTHKRHQANPEVEDVIEVVECESSYYQNDDVISFMEWLVCEREKLTTAIGEAKASVGFDIDAAVETNKFRQTLSNSIRGMVGYKPSKRTETGRDYKFNVEGNQTTYVYEVEVITAESYDKDRAKKVMRDVISQADRVSAEIDAAMINTVVNYTPRFDVNETFEDVMAEFVAERGTTE